MTLLNRERIHTLRLILAERLKNWPILQLFLFEFKFLVAFVLFFVLLGALGLCLPKIWKVSSPGLTPVIRISVLDMAQAWSLKRSALQSAAEGRWDNAAYCWEAAIGNNPADPSAFRGMLNLALDKVEVRKSRAANLPRYGFWLLRLGGTNQADVLLSARVLDAVRQPRAVLDLLELLPSSDESTVAGLRLRSLFLLGRMDEFAKLWEQAPASARSAPGVELCHAAWAAGWGPAGEAAAGRARLAAAAEDPATEEDASKLQLALARKRLDPALYESAFERLRNKQAALGSDHSGWWLLLDSTGRTAEARKLAGEFKEPFHSPQDCLAAVEAALRLELREIARAFLKQGLQQSSGSPELWIAYANLLTSQKRWEDLAEAAWQIRGVEAVSDALAVYSYYLEARAEFSMDRRQSAQATLQKLEAQPIGEPRFAWMAATGLLELNEPRLARDLLRKIQKNYSNEPGYWQAMVAAAVPLKDAVLLKQAATQAYQLAPSSPVTRNNFAASLLIFREQPEMSVKLTFEILESNPKSLQARLNHALALAQNYRYREAQAALAGIDGSRLSGQEALAFQTCQFEILAAAGNRHQALAIAASIDRPALMRPQSEWLDREIAKLGGSK